MSTPIAPGVAVAIVNTATAVAEKPRSSTRNLLRKKEAGAAKRFTRIAETARSQNLPTWPASLASTCGRSYRLVSGRRPATRAKKGRAARGRTCRSRHPHGARSARGSATIPMPLPAAADIPSTLTA
jgi:hypothetical protein